RERRRIRSISDRGPGADEDEGDFEIADETPGPSAIVEGGERAQLFWSAFRTLGARDREILALRHFKELSYKEMAAALGIPEGTVMSRLFHARRRLRENLDRDVFPPEETGVDEEVGPRGGVRRRSRQEKPR